MQPKCYLSVGSSSLLCACPILLFSLRSIRNKEDLHERDPALLVQRTRLVAVLPVRRDEGHHRDDACLGEERRDFGRAPYALGAVVRREAKVAREAGAQVVAVNPEDVLAELEEESLLERLCDRRLARPGQARPVSERDEFDGAASIQKHTSINGRLHFTLRLHLGYT